MMKPSVWKKWMDAGLLTGAYLVAGCSSPQKPLTDWSQAHVSTRSTAATGSTYRPLLASAASKPAAPGKSDAGQLALNKEGAAPAAAPTGPAGVDAPPYLAGSGKPEVKVTDKGTVPPAPEAVVAQASPPAAGPPTAPATTSDAGARPPDPFPPPPAAAQPVNLPAPSPTPFALPEQPKAPPADKRAEATSKPAPVGGVPLPPPAPSLLSQIQAPPPVTPPPPPAGDKVVQAPAPLPPEVTRLPDAASLTPAPAPVPVAVAKQEGPAPGPAPAAGVPTPPAPGVGPSAPAVVPAAVVAAPEHQPIQLTSLARPEPSRPVVTSNGRYAHAADYSALTGELYYIQTKNVWRLRYAPAGDEDRFGGTVTLVGNAVGADCHSGQLVRVEGSLVNPDAATPQAPYWARSVTVLKSAPPVED